MTGEGEGLRGVPSQLDLNNLVHKGELEVSIKPAESEQDGRARRTRETATFVLALVMVAIIFLVCLGVLMFGQPSTDEQRWLQSALTLILGAAVGAAFRK
jgi:hypothetical protein